MKWHIFKYAGAWCAMSDKGHWVWAHSRDELVRTLGLQEVG
jgi:hypothetical protein